MGALAGGGNSCVKPDWLTANLAEIEASADAVAGVVTVAPKAQIQVAASRHSELRLAQLHGRLHSLRARTVLTAHVPDRRKHRSQPGRGRGPLHGDLPPRRATGHIRNQRRLPKSAHELPGRLHAHLRRAALHGGAECFAARQAGQPIHALHHLKIRANGNNHPGRPVLQYQV